MYTSIVQSRGQVQFPEFTAERIYMHEFYKNDGLPAQYAHWQNTVDAMLNGIETDKPIYLMVDQAFVQGGNAHRRPGKHIDGYWLGGHGGHRIHTHGGSSGHSGHKGQSRHSASHSEGWNTIDFSHPEGIILASNIQACVAYTGVYDEQMIGNGGDASHIEGDFNRIELLPNTVYAGNVGMLHESLPVVDDCFRTVVRLNVPGWSPFNN